MKKSNQRVIITDAKSQKIVDDIVEFEGLPADRESADFSNGLTPSAVATMISAANTGDIKDQCRLAAEIEEKNWDVASAMQTRRNAIASKPWRIVPADGSDKAGEVAKMFESVLNSAGSENDLDTFRDLIIDLESAVLSGFAVSEIIWSDGGKNILGFNLIEQRFVTFKDSMIPLVKFEGNDDGEPLTPGKFIFHKVRRMGKDPVRGGIIRVLAWIHCFQNIDIKYMLAAIERFGMPFILAKVTEDQFKNELSKIRRIVSDFGSSGAGIVTNKTDIELIKQEGTAGDPHHKLYTTCRLAIERVILGQNASSGESSGLSGGDAQSDVRDDILRADCHAIADAINAKVLIPWFKFNFTDLKLLPKFEFVLDVEDEKAKAETQKIKAETITSGVNAGVLTPTEIVENFYRELVGLPELTEDEKSVRNTLKTATNQAETLGLAGEPVMLPPTIAEKAMAEIEGGAALETFGPTCDTLRRIVAIDDEAKFRAELEKVATDTPFGKTDKLRSAIEASAYTALANAVARRTKLVRGGGRGK